MGRISRGKKALAAVLFLWVVLANCLAGCTRNDAPEKLRDLEFTVVGDGEVPEELKNIIGEKQAAPFKLTYSDGQGLYIVQGYGEQETGGYSIAVRQLYDKVMGMHGLCGGNDFFFRGIELSIRNVVADRAGEQQVLLQHNAHSIPQGSKGIPAHILPADLDGAGGGIVQAGNQLYQRGFGRTRAA